MLERDAVAVFVDPRETTVLFISEQGSRCMFTETSCRGETAWTGSSEQLAGCFFEGAKVAVHTQR
jgi:hypothetical protein